MQTVEITGETPAAIIDNGASKAPVGPTTVVDTMPILITAPTTIR